MKNLFKITLLTIIFLIVAQSTFIANTVAKNVYLEKKDDQFIIVDINGFGQYDNIQDAINDAKPGSTIYVKNGEYNEILDIKKQITIFGEDRKSTLINPISEKNKYAVRLGASGIIFKGFSVKNDAPGLYTSAIRITSSKIGIYNCNIYETPIGIAIWTSDNIINNCNIWSCTDEAIALIGSSYSICKNNQIIDCKFYNNCDGIELQYSSYNQIMNCKFYDNSHTGIDAISKSNNNNLISNCEIYDNKVHGIFFSSSSKNEIVDCSIYNNEDGNIITRGKSKDNIISSNSNIKTIQIKQTNSLLDKISNPILQKIVNILNTISFFKENYKF